MQGEVEAADVGEVLRGLAAEGVEGCGGGIGGRLGGEGLLRLGVDGPDCGAVAEEVPEEFDGGDGGEVVWGEEAGQGEEKGKAGDMEGVGAVKGGGAVDVAAGRELGAEKGKEGVRDKGKRTLAGRLTTSL